MADSYERYKLYIAAVQEASYQERTMKNLKSAIKCLDRAEKLTLDPEELVHLRIWRSRLQKELEAKP